MWRATNNSPTKFRHAGFTVVELMLSVAVMGIIIFALYSVFNQTQRALRSTQTQGDVAEKARAIVDIISRELEQARPTFSPTRDTNMEINVMGGYEYGPFIQKSDRADIQPRTNFFHNLFFYTSHENAWQAMGYRVVNVTNGVGALLRFEFATNQLGRPKGNVAANAFINLPVTNSAYHHVADGVIHLSFIPYDANGFRLGYDTTNRDTKVYRIARIDNTGLNRNKSDVLQTNLANVLLYQSDPGARNETLQYATSFAFKSNAMPSYVEMEFGILEPETLSQYYLMKQEQNPNADKFLERQITKVHLFRQRIPIRTASQ